MGSFLGDSIIWIYRCGLDLLGCLISLVFLKYSEESVLSTLGDSEMLGGSWEM